MVYCCLHNDFFRFHDSIERDTRTSILTLACIHLNHRPRMVSAVVLVKRIRKWFFGTTLKGTKYSLAIVRLLRQTEPRRGFDTLVLLLAVAATPFNEPKRRRRHRHRRRRRHCNKLSLKSSYRLQTTPVVCSFGFGLH